MIGWRITKVRHPPFDGTGARLYGARWSSPGRDVIYASDTYAGAILEILAHATRPRTLPGPHHAVRIEAPDGLVEVVDQRRAAGWNEPGSRAARTFGDRWIDEGRTPVLSVPSLPARPIGRVLLVNPSHPQAGRLKVSRTFSVPWDDRLFE